MRMKTEKQFRESVGEEGLIETVSQFKEKVKQNTQQTLQLTKLLLMPYRDFGGFFGGPYSQRGISNILDKAEQERKKRVQQVELSRDQQDFNERMQLNRERMMKRDWDLVRFEKMS
mmetsp:Transcript_10559/g.17709  ORF Transcript_10559/g.17709 Transcript_10559/m.17709 type:complete len:116 (+) Transcript_10559:1145-1492(+)